MFTAFHEIQNRIKAAHTEAEWIVAGIQERLKSILRARALQREYPDMIHAASALTNPVLGLFPDEIDTYLQSVAEKRLQDPETDALDLVLAANFINPNTRRWASRTEADLHDT